MTFTSLKPLWESVGNAVMENPRLASASHYINVPFTVGTFTLNHDATLKILAFLFVTVPLGVIQWWNLWDKWQARRQKNRANPDSQPRS